jgi:ABC-2 type transport system ATP-binding protein
VDDALLLAAPEATSVHRHGEQIEVVGTGNLLHAVTSVLAAHQIIANDLRIEQASLDEAFVRLVGRD